MSKWMSWVNRVDNGQVYRLCTHPGCRLLECVRHVIPTIIDTRTASSDIWDPMDLVLARPPCLLHSEREGWCSERCFTGRRKMPKANARPWVKGREGMDTQYRKSECYVF